jgi:hypothetical protein
MPARDDTLPAPNALSVDVKGKFAPDLHSKAVLFDFVKPIRAAAARGQGGRHGSMDPKPGRILRLREELAAAS